MKIASPNFYKRREEKNYYYYEDAQPHLTEHRRTEELISEFSEGGSLKNHPCQLHEQGIGLSVERAIRYHDERKSPLRAGRGGIGDQSVRQSGQKWSRRSPSESAPSAEKSSLNFFVRRRELYEEEDGKRF